MSCKKVAAAAPCTKQKVITQGDLVSLMKDGFCRSIDYRTTVAWGEARSTLSVAINHWAVITTKNARARAYNYVVVHLYSSKIVLFIRLYRVAIIGSGVFHTTFFQEKEVWKLSEFCSLSKCFFVPFKLMRKWMNEASMHDMVFTI